MSLSKPSQSPATESPEANINAAMVTVLIQGKKFYASRTFWVNVIAVMGLMAQAQWGFIIGVETQAVLLSVVNLGLRAITRDAIVW